MNMKRLCMLVAFVWIASSIAQDILETHPRNKTRLNVNRPPEEEGSAFESDIILTKQQAEEIAADVLHQGKRKRRQAVISSTQLWPKGIIVYKYDDQFPTNYTGLKTKTNIARAMKMWEDTTCLRFRRNSPYVHTQVGHSSVVNILFGFTCQSVIGRTRYGQELEIGGNCINKVGSIAHELAHTAGLYHEHSRPDRDDNIVVYKDNAVHNATIYFNKNRRMRTYEPYDIESIMHYGPLFFTKDGKTPLYTIKPKDITLLAHMGQRTHLSFMNIKSINDLYNCSHNCPTALNCKNGGYIGPKCACTCPLELTGRYCTDVIRSRLDCGGVLKGSSGRFATPGFPNKYQSSTSCTWLIQSPPGSSINLRFTSFNIEPDIHCFYDYVEVKVYGPTLPGQRFCRKSPNVINYQGNALIVKFHSDDQYNYYGFQAFYSIH